MATNSDNFDRFRFELKREFEQLNDVQFSQFVRKVGLETLERVVMRTPVRTGRARGNWQVAITAPSRRVLDMSDPSGRETIERGRRELASVKIPPRIYITNNVPYIERLENGYSRRAPRGMVGITLEEIKARFG